MQEKGIIPNTAADPVRECSLSGTWEMSASGFFGFAGAGSELPLLPSSWQYGDQLRRERIISSMSRQLAGRKPCRPEMSQASRSLFEAEEKCKNRAHPGGSVNHIYCRNRSGPGVVLHPARINYSENGVALYGEPSRESAGKTASAKSIGGMSSVDKIIVNKMSDTAEIWRNSHHSCCGS